MFRMHLALILIGIEDLNQIPKLKMQHILKDDLQDKRTSLRIIGGYFAYERTFINMEIRSILDLQILAVN